MRSLLLLPALLWLCACAPFPEVEVPQGLAVPAEAPPLLPLDRLVAEAGAAQISPATTGSVEARAAALRARAAALQANPVQAETANGG